MHIDWSHGMVGMMTLLTVAATRIAFPQASASRKEMDRSGRGVTRD